MINETPFSLNKILSGASKTLNIAGQIIPLYQDSKPLVENGVRVYKLITNRNKHEKSDVKPNITYPKTINKPNLFI